MKVLRLSAVALAVSSLLAVAWTMGAGGCKGPDAIYVPNCFVPSAAEVSADGGPDPCHCNVPPPFHDNSCPCTSGDIFAEMETGIQVFQQCMALLPADAGGNDDAAEGGPLPACDGQCWPLPPPDWSPVLLWTGAESDAGCPNAAPSQVFGGSAYNASNTFAIGCSSNASGACPGLGDVCGPGPVDGGGFEPCVMHEGDFPCVSVGAQPAYPAWSLYYEGTPPQPIQVFTFCCFPAPPPQQ